LLCLALVGTLVSAYLLYVHRRLQVDPGWRSACALGGVINCDVVATSRYSSVAGIPLAAFGVWFYAVLAMTAAAGLRRRRTVVPRSPPVFLFAAGAVATLVSATLATVSVLALKAVCPLCVVLYLVGGAVLVVAWSALRRTGEPVVRALRAEIVQAWRHRRRTAAAGAVVLAIPALMFLLYSRCSPSRSATPEVACDKPSGSGPATLVVYSDFQCDFCRKVHLALRELRGKPNLRIVNRHYPLDAACNPKMKRSRHRGACVQARAAICAAEQHREEQMSDALFDGGPREEEGLLALAAGLGLDRPRFASCLLGERSARLLSADVDAAVADGVNATPTLFLDGRRHIGGLTPVDVACLARGGSPRWGK